MTEMPHLSTEQCWELLAAHEFGRLAFRLADEVHITPINYAVDPTGEAPTLLFRTAEGSKLLAVAMDGEVAFEIDEFAAETARSVVVRGRPRILEGLDARRSENVPLRPWVGDDKHHVVEIVPSQVTGRSFELHRPWTHLVLDPD